MADKISIEKEQLLAEFIAGFYGDPLGFVMAVYPWGEPFRADGSRNPLADKQGPEPWQKLHLKELGEHIRRNQVMREMGLDMKVWRSAVVSGHGVGKSALVAWIIHFMMSTRADTRAAVTASTQNQLEDKTWPELAKWHNLAINKHWFVWTATTYSFAAYAEDRRKNYRTTAASVSKDNTEAFAGLHNEGNTVFVIFDEASGVDGKVWEVADGALTDGEAFFFAYGNGTKPDGDFPDCFDKNAELMTHLQHVDSREVSFTNKNALEDILKKYGADSDAAKIRVLGQFPRMSYDGFLDVQSVRESMENESASPDSNFGLIMAVDVANRGGDETVIGYRQGWDARSIPMRTFKNLRHGEVLEQVQVSANLHKPDIIVIECVGIGIPLCDDLEDLGYRIFRAFPGAPVKDNYVNNRSLWWAALRDWLYEQLSTIPDDPILYDQLTKIQYYLNGQGKTLMESKKEMAARGLPSPDRADMLMLTHAVKIPRRNLNMARNAAHRKQRMENTDYCPLDF